MSGRAAQLSEILVPIDGSTDAKKATKAAITIGKATGAEIVFLNVIAGHTLVMGDEAIVGNESETTPTADDYYEAMEKLGKDIVDEAASDAKAAGVKARGMVMRAPAAVVEAIINQATKEKADVIVMGTRGLGGFKKLLVGSVSQGVLTHAPCSVLVVR